MLRVLPSIVALKSYHLEETVGQVSEFAGAASCLLPFFHLPFLYPMPSVTANEENVALADPRRFCTSATAWDVNEPPAVEPAVQTEASVEPTLA